ncbi:MAG: hypothetical protein HOP35_14280 [Nitrospira sp.]|nr:hypothetical protein [Nitrospira sp.]
MTITDFLSRLEVVKDRGDGRYSARCPAHQDQDPSLSVRDGEKGVLLHCWAGCDLSAIANKLGIEIKDLFHNSQPDPRQRREAIQRRAKERAAQRAVDKAKGRNTDLLKHAEYLVQSARGMTIDTWTSAQLDKRLNCLADAYAVLWGEHHEQH